MSSITSRKVVFFARQNVRMAYEYSSVSGWNPVPVKSFDNLVPSRDYVTHEIRCNDDQFKAAQHDGLIRG